MRKIDELPVEIIENILKSSLISVEDVSNFSSTNHYFRDIINNNQAIWKQKHRDKWPQLIDHFDKTYNNYSAEIRYAYDLKWRTRYMLETMPSRFYKRYELSDLDLNEWHVILNEKEQTYHYLVVDLLSIVNTDLPIRSLDVVPLNIPGNKTLQYYARKVLRYIRQLHLSQEWIKYINRPPNLQLLEWGAVFVAQWCQPHMEISYQSLSARLDYIARQVKQRLAQINPDHPIFKAKKEDLECWRNEVLEKNQWNTSDTQDIFNAMHHIFYKMMGFAGNKVAYYMPENSFINEVLDKRQGLPITLAIVYEAVIRRLGVKCDPINIPVHFMLRFNETKTYWYYIDVFYDGNVIAQQNGDYVPAATFFQVMERMANNLEVSARRYTQPNGRLTRLRSSLELLKVINPKDLSALVSLARIYMYHNMDTRPLQSFLLSQDFEVPEQAQRIEHMLSDYIAHHKQHEPILPSQVAQRTADTMFAVGMVMEHSTLKYKCVIYDWDPICLASENWQSEMKVWKLKYRNYQPFYNVLVEDGSYRYVAQENLEPTIDTGYLYLNEDVGRYFSHFYETHYVPNAEKEHEYPHDQNVRLRFYQEMVMEKSN